MHRDDLKSLLYFNAEAARELPEYAEFDELRTQIQENDDLWITDRDELEDFLYVGTAEIMADNITSAFARNDKETDVLGWSLKETMETLRQRYFARYSFVDEAQNPHDYVLKCIADLNQDMYRTAIDIVQMIMYLPEHMEHLEKHPKRNISKFDWKPK